MARLLFLICFLIASTTGPTSALAQEAEAKAPAADAGPKIDPAVAEELRYADGLNALGLSYYANLVLANIKGDDGGRKVVSEIKSLVGIKKFPEANALIAKQPDQDSQAVWAMKLTVADGYYGWGMYTNAQSLYESFFKKFSDGPPEALNDFYTKSGYKYAQMMLLTGQDKAALDAFRATLKAKNMDRAFKRQIQTEMAELMVKVAAKATGDERKKLFEEIRKICDEILWVQDVWFGKAIVMLAHIKMLQGDVDGAQKLVDDYWDQLKAIDDMLREDAKEQGDELLKISPMANCHYMLGVIMQDEAEKLIAANGEKEKIIALLVGKVTGKKADGKDKRTFGALQHLMTVFASYPSTSWAPDAGLRGQKVQERLQSLGVEIKITISPEKMKEIMAIQFREARSMFNLQQWADAAEAYARVLKLFPEGETSMGALSELATCYIELQEQIFADAVIHHLAERFGGDSPQMAAAGDQVLRMAVFYNDRKMMEKKDETYNLYFQYYAKHSRMPSILYSFGLQKMTTEDYAGALDYFQKVKTSYSNSTPCLDSINRMATCYEKLGDRTNEVKILQEYVQKLEQGAGIPMDSVRGKYRLAVALRQLGPKNVPAALNRFAELAKLLSDPKHPYQKTPEEKEAADRILEGSMFQKSICYAVLTEPQDKMAEYKQNALDGFTSLVSKFPKSVYAPSSLAQIGTLWTILKDPDKAQAALTRLQRDYPDSEPAKNVDYMIADNMLKLGRPDEARKAFKRMFDQSGSKYTEIQILTAGEELLKSKEHEIAHQAFSKIHETTKDPKIKELALVKDGQCLVETGSMEDAVKVLENLFKLYPRSFYTIDGSFALSRAYTGLGAKEADEQKRSDLFTKAIKAMNKASTYEKKPDGLLRIDLAVARMWLMRAKAEEQFKSQKGSEYKGKAIGGYQSIILLNSPDKADLRPMIEEAYNECIPLFVELAQWPDVLENCDKYLTAFPKGRFLADVRRWRNKARMNTEGSGQKAPEEPSGNVSAVPIPGTDEEDETETEGAQPVAGNTNKPPATADGAVAPEVPEVVAPGETPAEPAAKSPAAEPAGTNKPQATTGTPGTVKLGTNRISTAVQGTRLVGTNRVSATTGSTTSTVRRVASTNRTATVSSTSGGTVRAGTNATSTAVSGTRLVGTNRVSATTGSTTSTVRRITSTNRTATVSSTSSGTVKVATNKPPALAKPATPSPAPSDESKDKKEAK
jgi:tetratricopeptide (TPR) repeat protein